MSALVGDRLRKWSCETLVQRQSVGNFAGPHAYLTHCRYPNEGVAPPDHGASAAEEHWTQMDGSPDLARPRLSLSAPSKGPSQQAQSNPLVLQRGDCRFLEGSIPIGSVRKPRVPFSGCVSPVITRRPLPARPTQRSVSSRDPDRQASQGRSQRLPDQSEKHVPFAADPHLWTVRLASSP